MKNLDQLDRSVEPLSEEEESLSIVSCMLRIRTTMETPIRELVPLRKNIVGLALTGSDGKPRILNHRELP